MITNVAETILLYKTFDRLNTKTKKGYNIKDIIRLDKGKAVYHTTIYAALNHNVKKTN